MSTHAAFHGSDLELIAQHYNIPKESITSFSANVNPMGLSPQFLQALSTHLDAVMEYPDRDYTDLRHAISQYCHAAPEHILVGSGATELISLFIGTIAPKKAMLVDPTYSEYARNMQREGGKLISYQLRPEHDFHLDITDLCHKLDSQFDLLILCNPNNPTSTALRQEEMRTILAHCQTHHIYVMVDETYVEFAPDSDQITSIPLTEEYDNLFVLRGVSKFFSAPGLRLGYCVTGSTHLLDAVSRDKDPWSLNALAAVAGGAMFSDQEFICRTRHFVQTEMERLCTRLQQNPSLHVYPPVTNFVLLRLEDPSLTSSAAFEFAIREGLMIRDCSSFPALGSQHIRFCLNKPAQNDRLMDVLERFTGTIGSPQ